MIRRIGNEDLLLSYVRSEIEKWRRKWEGNVVFVQCSSPIKGYPKVKNSVFPRVTTRIPTRTVERIWREKRNIA